MSDQVPSSNPLRDQLRSQIFAAKPTSERATLNGVEVELRQPKVSDIMDQNPDDEDSRKLAFVNQLVRSVYVPGTDTPVFDPEDADMLRQLSAKRCRICSIS